MTILITVPHAGCREYPITRNCDRAARQAALTLKQLIPDSKLHIGNVFRADLDLNRDVALQHPFRGAIRQAIATSKINFVLDVHSYPFPDDFGNSDFTILDESPGTWYGRSLFQFMTGTQPKRNGDVQNSHGYRIAYYYGAGNSIMREARALGIPSLLVEYGEFLSSEDIEYLSSMIVDWLQEEGFS